jgi:hypothetical protein
MIWQLQKPGKAKKLRRFHHNHRIVNKRAKQRRSWRFSGWIIYNDNGRWKIIWTLDEVLPNNFTEKDGQIILEGYPNRWLKNDNNCNSKRCRCHRKGRYKKPSSERPWGHRKGWNKFKCQEWKFHEDVSNDWITEIYTSGIYCTNAERRQWLFWDDDYEYSDPVT